jgi:hypothetical protein
MQTAVDMKQILLYSQQVVTHHRMAPKICSSGNNSDEAAHENITDNFHGMIN